MYGTDGLTLGGPMSLPSNPFATRFTRPGVIPYLTRSGTAVREIAERVLEQQCSQIIGPHGTGKSTLLAELAPILAPHHHRVFACCLHDGEKRLPLTRKTLSSLREGDLLVIDGYEQLRSWNRPTWRARRQRFRLLVTAHADVGMQPLHETSADLSTVRRIVDLLDPTANGKIDERTIQALVDRHGQNVREILFELYDLWQNQVNRRSPD